MVNSIKWWIAIFTAVFSPLSQFLGGINSQDRDGTTVGRLHSARAAHIDGCTLCK